MAGVRDATGRAASGEELLEQVSTRLRRIVPFDGATWFATDPSTVLATLPVPVENVQDGHCQTFWEREHQVEDVLLFRDLARSQDGGVGTLHHATAGTPERSARAREFLRPQGYGDELRAAFRTGPSTWGVVGLPRAEADAVHGPRAADPRRPGPRDRRGTPPDRHPAR